MLKLIPLILFVEVVFCQQNDPVVTFPLGQVVGKVLTSRRGFDFYAFRGLPYAEPPTGNLRFKPPVSKNPWSGVYDATNDVRACPQPNETDSPRGEDCLFLQVYTKRINSGNDLKPVFFWIHGGSFFAGSGNSIQYGPEYIMDTDIVLVCINYRLGTLGFFSTGDEQAPGNYGLKDQVEAMRWVQQYIQFFGGDPKRVTIAGESAGSASVIFHMISPMSKGLFHQVIAISGSASNFWAIDKNPMYHAKKQAALLQCPTDTAQNIVNCMKQVSAEELADTYHGLTEWRDFEPAVLMAPVVETVNDGSERFLVEDPRISLKNGDFSNVPLIIGTTKDEFAVRALVIVNNDGMAQDLSQNWNELAPIALMYPRNDYVSTQLRLFYLGSLDQPITNSSYYGLGKLYADSVVIYGTIQGARLIAEKSAAPVYLFQFNYEGSQSSVFLPKPQRVVGMQHGDELIYLFWLSQDYPKLDVDSEDGKCATRFITLLTNFVNFGNPTPGLSDILNNVIWTPFTNNEPQYLDINRVLNLQHGLYYQERMSFMESLFPL